MRRHWALRCTAIVGSMASCLTLIGAGEGVAGVVCEVDDEEGFDNILEEDLPLPFEEEEEDGLSCWNSRNCW
jgi:hypothetical protein